jgi:ribosomal protein L40E
MKKTLDKKTLDKKTCLVCGAKIRITANYCTQCGSPAKEGVEPVER